MAGFGKDEIRNFVERSFPTDKKSVDEFMKQLDEYPHLYSLCYVPMNLVMIVSIFHRHEKLPSTLTELYRLFIVMILKKQVSKNKNPAILAVTVSKGTREIFSKMLPCISKQCRETMGTVYFFSCLAYYGYFNCYGDTGRQWKDPKMIFTNDDLTAVITSIQPDCPDIQITDKFDGLGLLKIEHVQQVPIEVTTYNFTHLTIQEFFAALYISTLSLKEQLDLLSKRFHDYPNVFVFLRGLKGLSSKEMFEFVLSKLKSALYKHVMSMFDPDVVTAVKCIYESKLEKPLMVSSSSCLEFNISHNILLPYECLCASHVLSSFPVSQLNMGGCHIGNKGVEMLLKHYPNKNTNRLLEVVRINANDLTIEGFTHVMQIVHTCKANIKVLAIYHVMHILQEYTKTDS